MNRRTHSILLLAALLVPGAATGQLAAPAPVTLRLPVELLKSNKKGKTFPFNNKDGTLFKLEVRLYLPDGADPKGTLVHEETQFLTIPVEQGQAIIEIGKLSPLPTNLATGDLTI